MDRKLNDAEVRKLPAPASGNRLYYDDQVKGLTVRVTAAGARAWVLRYRAGRRQRAYTIGSFPDWSTSAAREQARALKRRIDDGQDPMGDRHAERAAPTVEDLTKRYLGEHATRRLRPRSAAEMAGLIRQLIVPKLGSLRVADVRRADVEAFHRDVSKTAPVRANRAVSLLRSMFNLAIRWDMRAHNPATGIERNPEHKRDRYLAPNELERLMTALAESHSRSSANAIRLLLLTGARRGEVLGATWDQFSDDFTAWSKPGATTKQKTLHRVPLSAPARLLLAEMRAKADDPVMLFPGRRENEAQGDLKKFWAATCKRAGIEGVRVHDLRHSFASYLASGGLSLPVIGALLGHSNPATTARYSHLLDQPLLAATEKVGAMVEAASGAAAHAAPVVMLRGRR